MKVPSCILLLLFLLWLWQATNPSCMSWQVSLLPSGPAVPHQLCLNVQRKKSRAIRVGSQWTSTRASTTTVLIFSLLCLSGDIELNPGPVKYPCKVCDRSVKSNQQGIQCECCYSWLHAKIMHSHVHRRISNLEPIR